MSDNLRRYCALRDALLQHYPQKPDGHLACHLRTLAMLISGIVGSRKTNLPAVSSKAPNLCKRESRTKRLERFLRNERIEPDVFFLPFVRALLAGLPPGPLVLVMSFFGLYWSRSFGQAGPLLFGQGRPLSRTADPSG